MNVGILVLLIVSGVILGVITRSALNNQMGGSCSSGLLKMHRWFRFNSQRVCPKCGKLQKREWKDDMGNEECGYFWFDDGYIDNPLELINHWKQLILEEEQENKPKPIQYKHWGVLDQMREIEEASRVTHEERKTK